MASRAIVQIEPETMRLYAFTIEAVTNEIEKNLLDPAKLATTLAGVITDESLRVQVAAALSQAFQSRPTISGRPAGDILRDLAANMRAGAEKSEAEFTQRASGREERRARREQRQRSKTGTGRDFTEGGFPGAADFFNQAGFQGAGGGQMPPGVPPVETAQPVGVAPVGAAPATGGVSEKDFNDDSL